MMHGKKNINFWYW